ncbi:MAG TPA: DNA polymerase I [Steroidobacteraceae bacterium]|jgi:DNA polymerase-1|nr:DNA polymerase I [Steroidobacteraceae bacterium]
MTRAPDLVLVDGSSYLYRAFHALPAFSTTRGEPTGAMLGVLNMMNKFMKDYAPKRVALVFDASGRTFRDDIFNEYKAHRTPMPDDLRAQIEPLFTILRAQGYPVLRMEGVEADDVIGTLACRAARSGQQVLISTADKDMAQLVDGSITLINTMSNTVLDRAGVKAKFDVYPEQIIDYLALVGDSSDNIPGIEKVGPKTAAKLLGQYGTLDELIAHVNEVPGKVGENLRAGLETLELSRKLARIHTDLDLPVDIGDLTLREPDVNALRELYTRYELRSLLRALEGNTPPGGAPTGGGTTVTPAAGGALPLFELSPPTSGPQSGTASSAARASGTAVEAAVARESGAASPQAVAGTAAQPAVERHYETITEWSQLERWIEKLRNAELFAFDSQTIGPDYMQAEIVGVAFATEPGVAAYVPLQHEYAGAPAQLDRARVLAALKPLLEDPERPKAGNDLKYDAHVLLRYDIHLAGMRYDTMLESYVWNSVATKHDLDSNAGRYLGVRTILLEDIAGKGAKQLPFNQIAVEQAAEYSQQHVDIVLRLHRMLWSQLQTVPEQARLYEEVEQPLVPVLVRMEQCGVLVDRELLKKQSGELSARLEEIRAAACKEAGYDLNMESPKQLQHVLFDKLQLPVLRKTPSGQPSTAEDVLEELAVSYTLPRLILDYRGMAKLKSTYTDKLPDQINPRTKRIHTSYRQAIAATGRLSSADPNLQNIPIRTAEGRRIRQAFIAPPGYLLLAADYSQIELRIMAHLSGDEGLMRAFAEDLDVHEATAAEVFGVPLESVTADQRRLAKTINFGLIYGMSAFGVARNLGIERGVAAKYVETYFARYPGVKSFMDRTRAQARELGYVETVFGRRLYLPDIRAGNAQLRQYAERAAINAPMQGTAADIIKRAMIEVDAWLLREDVPARLIMQVHDELVFEVRQDAVEDVKAPIAERMVGAAELKVPLRIELGVGANWDEAH